MGATGPERVPEFSDAVISLAAAELAAGELTRAENLLRSLLADSRVAQIDAARAGGLLADVLDAGGRYEEALAAYTACNTALRQIYAQFFAGETPLITYANQLTATISNTADRYRSSQPQSVRRGRRRQRACFSVGISTLGHDASRSCARWPSAGGQPR